MDVDNSLVVLEVAAGVLPSIIMGRMRLMVCLTCWSSLTRPGKRLSVSGVLGFLTQPHTYLFSYRYVFQEERGDNGTPHLQGVIHFKNQVALTTLKQWNLRLHLESTRCIKSSVAYCSDPGKRAGRIWNHGFTVRTELRLLEEDNFYEWQKDLVAELLTVPNDRSIIWYADLDGGTGKTQLAKWIFATMPGVQYISSSNLKDATYQIIKRVDDPRILLCNLPRSAEGKLSYAIFESIKDGIVYSGKYEGGTRIFPSPHIVVFTNFFPDETQLTHDRWDIRTLRNNPPRRANA